MGYVSNKDFLVQIALYFKQTRTRGDKGFEFQYDDVKSKPAMNINNEGKKRRESLFPEQSCRFPKVWSFPVENLSRTLTFPCGVTLMIIVPVFHGASDESESERNGFLEEEQALGPSILREFWSKSIQLPDCSQLESKLESRISLPWKR